MNFIIAMILIALVAILASAALGMYIAGEKGKKLWIGAIIGGALPFIGLILLATMSATDENILDEAYSRKLLTLEEYENTKEIKLKEKKNKKSS